MMPELSKKPAEQRRDSCSPQHSAVNSALDRAKVKSTNPTTRKSGTPTKRGGS